MSEKRLRQKKTRDLSAVELSHTEGGAVNCGSDSITCVIARPRGGKMVTGEVGDKMATFEMEFQVGR